MEYTTGYQTLRKSQQFVLIPVVRLIKQGSNHDIAKSFTETEKGAKVL